jgi:hypothetical protein
MRMGENHADSFQRNGPPLPDPFFFRNDDGKFYIYNTGIDCLITAERME